MHMVGAGAADIDRARDVGFGWIEKQSTNIVLYWYAQDSVFLAELDSHACL